MPLRLSQRRSFRQTIGAGIAALGVAALGASASAQSAAKVFDLTVAGVPIGTVTLAAEQSGSDYAAVSKIVPNTLVNLVAGYAFDGRARGVVDAEGKITPTRFEADSTSPRATRRTEIDWRDGAPVRVSVEPPRRSTPDPAGLVGAIDPVSAGFALLRDNTAENICDTSIEVFDGSRRSRLSLSKAVARDAGFTCEGLYARIEGEAHTMSSQSAYPFTLTFAPSGDGLVRLERIETRTRFGLAVISLRG